MKAKKGQAAMEFLMTYGWAILVVLAAIGALAYFGILNPGNWLPTKCTISGGFSCQEYKLSNDTLTLYIRNNLGTDAVVSAIAITSTDCTPGAVAGFTATNTIQNGDIVADDPAAGVTSACTLTSGNRFRGKITITYTKVGETQSHEASGDITTKVET